MRFYETIFIARADLSDEELTGRVEWVTDILTSNGAQVVNVEQWGKKRLAYQVRKQRYGIYFLFHYEGEPEVVTELERNFKLSENILKYLTVKLDDKQVEKARAAAKKAAEQAEEDAAKAEAAKAEAASEAESEKPVEAPEVAAEATSEVPTETEEGEPIQTAQEED